MSDPSESIESSAPLEANIKRQAVDSLKGYDYQIWRSVFAWLELEDEELLFLEGAENFDRVKGRTAEIVQIKETAGSGPKTLRSADILMALGNYLEVVSKNPNRRIEFKFVTTSGAGREQGAPFGPSNGIDVWRECQRARDPRKAIELAELLRSFLLSLVTLPVPVREFLGRCGVEEFRSQLVMPIQWFICEPATDAIAEAVRRKIVVDCD